MKLGESSNMRDIVVFKPESCGSGSATLTFLSTVKTFDAGNKALLTRHALCYLLRHGSD